MCSLDAYRHTYAAMIVLSLLADGSRVNNSDPTLYAAQPAQTPAPRIDPARRDLSSQFHSSAPSPQLLESVQLAESQLSSEVASGGSS